MGPQCVRPRLGAELSPLPDRQRRGRQGHLEGIFKTHLLPSDMNQSREEVSEPIMLTLRGEGRRQVLHRGRPVLLAGSRPP